MATVSVMLMSIALGMWCAILMICRKIPMQNQMSTGKIRVTTQSFARSLIMPAQALRRKWKRWWAADISYREWMKIWRMTICTPLRKIYGARCIWRAIWHGSEMVKSMKLLRITWWHWKFRIWKLNRFLKQRSLNGLRKVLLNGIRMPFLKPCGVATAKKSQGKWAHY